MIKVRPTTPEEEAECAQEAEELADLAQSGEIREGEPGELAAHISSGKEVVLSDQVREFLRSQGMSEDEFIANILQEGKRTN